MILWALNASLKSPQDFDDLIIFLAQPFAKFILWCVLSAFLYHSVAGIRHLLMDMQIGEELRSGRIGAMLTLVISGLLILLTGIWLW